MSKRSRDDLDGMREDIKRHRSQHGSDLPDIHSVFCGEVARVQPYGAFVKIPGCRKQGLVHKSQMSTTRVDDPSELVAMGETVYCKVISMEEDGEKIALSMKTVNQATGQDLDPNNVQLSLDERKKRKGHQSEIPKIELGAVFDTTCKKCGGHGHLAQDCFHVKGGKNYDLIPDLANVPAAEVTPTDDNLPSPKKKKKNKKEKKHKKSKKKKHKHKHSHSSSESSSPVRKKKRRHRHRSTGSDDGSDSSPTHKTKHKKHKSRKHHSSGPSEVQKKLLKLACYH